MAGSKEELKNLLIRVKVESERASLKLNSKKKRGGIWPHNFMLNTRGKGGNSDRLSLLGL